MNEATIETIKQTINCELENRGFQNMDVTVDEGAFEPAVTFFTTWYDDTLSVKQAKIISEDFNLFKTTNSFLHFTVLTQEDTRVYEDGNSASSVEFVAEVNETFEYEDGTKHTITDDDIVDLAREYANQLTEFWDTVYSNDLVEEHLRGGNYGTRRIKTSNACFRSCSW